MGTVRPHVSLLCFNLAPLSVRRSYCSGGYPVVHVYSPPFDGLIKRSLGVEWEREGSRRHLILLAPHYYDVAVTYHQHLLAVAVGRKPLPTARARSADRVFLDVIFMMILLFFF